MSGALEGKKALVVGASAAGGSGWAIAETYAGAGAQVAVAARSFHRLRELAPSIGAFPIACDVTEEGQVADAAARVLREFGGLDIAVNCAGEAVNGTIDDSTDDNLMQALRANYISNVYFVKHMARAIQEDGSIVLLSSMSATHPSPLMFAYSCAKAATDCLVRFAAIEYGGRRIKVNSILPCAVRSDMVKEIFATPGFEEAYASEVPLGRVGEPRDVADAALWLAGPSYVTGLNLQMNGGNHLTRYPKLSEIVGDMAGVMGT